MCASIRRAHVPIKVVIAPGTVMSLRSVQCKGSETNVELLVEFNIPSWVMEGHNELKSSSKS